MASVCNDPGGRKRILFIGPDGERRAVRLGKASVKQAEAFKVRVERLVSAGLGHPPDDETTRWVATLDDIIHGRLAKAGLVPPRGSAKLAPFIDRYIADRCDVKRATATVYGHTRRNLVEHFGPDKPLREITDGAADGWRLYLIGQGLADNTVRRRCGIAKQFFRAAVRRKLIAHNPFADLKAAILANAKRFYYVTQAEAEEVLEACPDAEWRLLFALSRYGGLRCPSEHLALRWADVDWDRGRILVHSPKTAHHPGGESRLVPLFPELRAPLLEVFEQAEPGTEYVITRYRDTNANLRTQLNRIIRRAGLKPWPKLFQNLRSTRETELAEQWPEHVVCAWMGNSRATARKHYLQVTDEHFEQAAMTEPADKAAQNPAQYEAVLSRKASHTERETAKSDQKRRYATPCECGMGDGGLEPPTSSL